MMKPTENKIKNGSNSILSVKQADINDAEFVEKIFSQNKAVLHAENIGINQWREILTAKDPDEIHFIVYKDVTPVAYIKINGLQNPLEWWISMLIVATEHHRQGIGSFALSYAEGFVKLHNIKSLKIQTDVDNIPAISCYLKSGYRVYEKSKKIKFFKEI